MAKVKEEEEKTVALKSRKNMGTHTQIYFLVMVTQHFVGIMGLMGGGAAGLYHELSPA